MLECFVSRARLTVDNTDLALLRLLATKDAQTTDELTESLASEPEWTSIGDLERRLELLASIAAVSSPGSMPPIWINLQCGARGAPFVDFVEITNCCPSSCVMCRAAHGFMERPRGFMRMALFERLIEMIGPRPDLKPLILHNAGEPLLHPDLFPMVALASRSAIPTEISTNAGLLTLTAYEKLCDAGIARIVIALDGTDEKTLTAIRGTGARPHAAFATLDAILAARAKTRMHRPALVVQMVRMKPNAHQHRAFRDRYGHLGLPGVSAFLKPLEAPADDPLFEPGARSPQFFCAAPWQSLGIFWDGRVVPCCYDLNASLCIGDINRQTLDEIWRGAPLSGLRARLTANRCLSSELCSICHHRPDRYERPDLSTISEIPDDWH